MKQPHTSVFLRYKGQMKRFLFSDIISIESQKDYCLISTISGKYRIHSGLCNLLKSMPSHIVRCHHSYAVNITKIKSIEENCVYMERGGYISIDRSIYKKDFFSQLNILN
jgi:DNA-binding LytR/AlgR family response regulator